jgi:Protein of unknown function (DUF3109)
MFIIGEAFIEDRVGDEEFACDPGACRGACCTLEGGRGAPLDDREVEEIRRTFPAVERILPERSLQTIREVGLVEGVPGDYATPCVERRECVYVYFERGIARCSFERAYLAGETRWRKPLSCHLFPLRVRRFGQEFLHYEEIEECAAGRRRGSVEGISLSEFLKEPLVRRFGATWYETFAAECSARRR